MTEKIHYSICIALCSCCPRPDLRHLAIEADVNLLMQGLIRCHHEDWQVQLYTEGTFMAPEGIAIASEEEPVVTLSALVEALGR